MGRKLFCNWKSNCNSWYWFFFIKSCLTKGTIVVFILIRCGFTIGFSLALLIPSMRSLRPIIRSKVKINAKIIAVETQLMQLGKESLKKKKKTTKQQCQYKTFNSYITTIRDSHRIVILAHPFVVSKEAVMKTNFCLNIA